MTARWAAPAVLLLAVTGAARGVEPEPEAWAAGSWRGEIRSPRGGPLPVRIELERTGGAWRGSADLPAEGAVALPLAAIAVEEATVAFELAGVPGRARFEGRRAGDEIRGVFLQTGARLPFELRRSEERNVANGEGRFRLRELVVETVGARLAGTLTLPRGAPRAGAVLLSGSGAQDRDGEIFGRRPLRALAEGLAEAGIASLRMDDRGIGGSSGDLASITTVELAADAAVLVEVLAARPELAGRPVGAIGHSEGAAVAALAATRSGAIDFVVLLAGPGVPGRELVPEQARRIGAVQGVPAGTLEGQVALLDRALGLLESGAAGGALEDDLRELLRRRMELAGSGVPENADPLLDREVGRLLSPWFRHFLRHDPAAVLAALEVPVLALSGSLDMQVPGDQSLPPIRAALAGHADATVSDLPGLNHLLQRAETGSPSEYYRLEDGLAPEALDAIAEWILQRAPATAGGGE